MSKFFVDRHYPRSLIQEGLHRADQFTRQQALQPTDRQTSKVRPVVSSQYYPVIHKGRKILLSNWAILHSRPEVAEIFNEPPLMWDINLKDWLVRS
jgi:hypothetical protein